MLLSSWTLASTTSSKYIAFLCESLLLHRSLRRAGALDACNTSTTIVQCTMGICALGIRASPPQRFWSSLHLFLRVLMHGPRVWNDINRRLYLAVVLWRGGGDVIRSWIVRGRHCERYVYFKSTRFRDVRNIFWKEVESTSTAGTFGLNDTRSKTRIQGPIYSTRSFRLTLKTDLSGPLLYPSPPLLYPVKMIFFLASRFQSPCLLTSPSTNGIVIARG